VYLPQQGLGGVGEEEGKRGKVGWYVLPLSAFVFELVDVAAGVDGHASPGRRMSVACHVWSGWSV
jgi:hypothetical protein